MEMRGFLPTAAICKQCRFILENCCNVIVNTNGLVGLVIALGTAKFQKKEEEKKKKKSQIYIIGQICTTHVSLKLLIEFSPTQVSHNLLNRFKKLSKTHYVH